MIGFSARISEWGVLNHDNLNRGKKDATFFTRDRLRGYQFHSMGVVHQTSRACDDHFLSRVRVGFSHALGHRALRENKGRAFANFK
jgi:hypothetical protein